MTLSPKLGEKFRAKGDIMEKNKTEVSSMKSKRLHSFVLLAILLLGLLTACGTSPAGESQPQSALVRYDHPIGISLSMAEGFTETEAEGFLGGYTSEAGDIGVIFAEELYESMENFGLDSDLTLEEYAQLIADSYGLDTAPTTDTNGNLCLVYLREVNGRQFTYYAYFNQNDVAFWTTTFMCLTDESLELADDFATWASSIEIPAEAVTDPVQAEG